MTEAVDTVLTLTESAASRIQEVGTSEPDHAGKHLRVYVEKGGCSGLQYGMVFDELRDGDLVSEAHGVRVLVDAFSAKFVRGTVLDFDSSLSGGGFKLRNPNARESCGCGKSFAA